MTLEYNFHFDKDNIYSVQALGLAQCKSLPSKKIKNQFLLQIAETDFHPILQLEMYFTILSEQVWTSPYENLYKSIIFLVKLYSLFQT